MKTPTLALVAATAILLAAPVVSAASLSISSGEPHPGDYTMTVDVKDYQLKPLGTTPGDASGQGHIHYLVKVEGKGDFVDACTAKRADCSAPTDYATPSTSFTFKHLTAGDVVGARLARNDHASLNPDVMQQKTVMSASSSSQSSPGVGVLVAVGLLGFAAFVRRTE